MSRQSKRWIVIASCLLIIGGVVFGGVMTMFKWDFSKLSTVRYETNEYKIREEYTDILIVADTADIVFVPAENGETTILCCEQIRAKHSVTVTGSTLEIRVVDERKWYDHIGIFTGTPKITVSIPRGEHGVLSVNGRTGDVEIHEAFHFESMDILESTGDVMNHASASEAIQIRTSTGDILVENVSAGTIDLSVSTGNVTVAGAACREDLTLLVSTGGTSITDASCRNIITSGRTGDLSMKNVVVEELLSVERSTGDVKLEASDAAEITVRTNTGDVTGTLLTDKVFLTQTATGHVDVPKTGTGGRCEITTRTGNIIITVG